MPKCQRFFLFLIVLSGGLYMLSYRYPADEKKQLYKSSEEIEKIVDADEKKQLYKSSEEIEKIVDAKERIAARMERIRKICAEQNYPNFNSYGLYFFKTFGTDGITWCPVFKAGSTTWRDFFINHVVDPKINPGGSRYSLNTISQYRLTRFITTHDSVPGKSRIRTYPDETDNSLRFALVRHPIARLISHLRLAQNFPFEVHRQREWTEESIVNARTNSSWDEATRKQYREELTKYVDELEPVELELVKHTPFSQDNPYLHPPYPTFSEMVDFIQKHREPRVDQLGSNGHWRPAVIWCDVCQHDFDIIIQLEREPDELIVLLEKLGMLQHICAFMKKHNSSNEKSNSEQELMQKYINALNSKQIEFLNRMYARDFQLLGYEPIHSTLK